MAAGVTLRDLSRDPGEVARGLDAWRRGEPDEAARLTLAASQRELHGRAYTFWVWTGRTGDGAPAWALPVSAEWTARFAPRGPARALARTLGAAELAGAAPARVRLEDWHGYTCLVAAGLDEELAGVALAEVHPAPCRTGAARLPDEVRLGGPPIPLRPPPPGGRGHGLAALAGRLHVHPVRVALTLIEHGQRPDLDVYPPELTASLREWGCSGEPLPEPPRPRLGIADDPCPRRRHARTVLQRMLRMGKVGDGYHTEFSHVYRGAAPHERDMALMVGEALLRAGLLGAKPSVGQRHVYLRREALPDIHALIERGETRDGDLAEVWTHPAPGAATRPAPSP